MIGGAVCCAPKEAQKEREGIHLARQLPQTELK
jgi:hypothetical protein